MKFVQGQIDIVRSFTPYSGELSFLYYQLSVLNNRLDELTNENNDIKILKKEREDIYE